MSVRFAGLRRITAGGRFIPEIDGFRLVAILVVLLDHIHLQVARALGVSWPEVLTLPGGGTRGVFLFFTISGFILGLPFARSALTDLPERERRRFSYRGYLLRRLTRLEPPYVLILLLRLILLLTVMHAGAQSLLPHFAASLFYLHNLIFGSMSPVSPPTWSLEVEVQFYLLAPLLAAPFNIRSATHRRVLLAGATLGFGFVAQYYTHANPRIGLSLAGNLQYFTAGLLLCDLHVTRPFPKIRPAVWDIAAIATLILLLWDDSPWILNFFPFGTVLVYLAGLRGHFVRECFAAPVVSIAGGMCYSVYLTHGTVLAFIGIAFGHFPIAALPGMLQGVMVLGVSLSAVFMVGTVVFVLLERPCMDPSWPHKIAERLTALRHKLPVSSGDA